MRVRAPAAPQRPAVPGRRRARIRVGVHRPAADHPGRLRTGLTHEALGVTCQVRSSTIGNRRDQAAAGRTRIRRLATTRPAPAHPGRRVRLRRGRKRHTAHLRHRNPGPPAEGRTLRTGRLRLRSAQAEHDQDHHHQRRPGTRPVVRGGAAAGCTTRSRCAPRVPLGSSGSATSESRGLRRLPGTCQRVSPAR